MIPLLLALSPQASAGECIDLVDSLRAISAALDEVRLDDARALSEEIEGGLLCQTEQINPLGVTALFQVAGAVHFFLGDLTSAERHFERALVLSPSARLDPQFGEDAAVLYETLRGRLLDQPPGQLYTDTGVRAWVNGRELRDGESLDLPPGQHLLQLPEGDVFSTSVVTIGSGEQLAVDIDGALRDYEPPIAPAPIADDSFIDDGSGPRWGLVIGGGLGLVGGGGALLMASQSHAAFYASQDYDALSGLRLRTNALTVTGVALGGVGAGFVVGGLVSAGPTIARTPGGASLGVQGRW